MASLMQDLMKSAPDTPNVVEACNLEGRQERLDGLLSQLEMCEKALQVFQTNLPVCNYCLAISMDVTVAASCDLLYTASQNCIPRLTQVLLVSSGLPGDQACGLPTLLLCGSCRSAGHSVQGF